MQILRAHLLVLLLLVSCSSAFPAEKPPKSTSKTTGSTLMSTSDASTTRSSSSTGLSTSTEPSTQAPTSTGSSTNAPTSSNSHSSTQALTSSTSTGTSTLESSSTTAGNSTASPTESRNATAPPQETGGRGNETCSKGTTQKTPSKRASKPVTHPSAKGPIPLFHGTSSDSAARDIAQGGIRLSEKPGDFNPPKGSSGSEGGFYLTDSLASAAQFACYGGDLLPTRPVPEKVHVLEFIWEAGAPVHEFTTDTASDQKRQNFMQFNAGQDPAFQASATQILANTMITGPMNIPGVDSDLTPDFWQYAIIKEAGVGRLRYVATHENILCANVPRGARLSAKEYRAGQRNKPQKFNALVKDYRDPDKCLIM